MCFVNIHYDFHIIHLSKTDMCFYIPHWKCAYILTLLTFLRLTVWRKAGLAAAGTLLLNDRAWKEEHNNQKWNKLKLC